MKKLAIICIILLTYFQSVTAQQISPWGMGLYPLRFDQTDLSTALKQSNQLGIKWTRMDLNWPTMESEQGVFNWKRVDWRVDSVRKHGIKILAILGYTPKWLSNNAPNTERQRKIFGEYVYKMVNHFKGRIEFWEIWNEPNGDGNWPPKSNVANYTKLLKVAYMQAKKADPGCTVLAPGLSYCDPNFINGIYENGGAKYFDMLSFHPYASFSGGPSDVNLVWGVGKIRSIMRKYGDVKPLWISEFGYSTAISRRQVTEQASGLVRLYIQSLALGIKNIMWYDYRDDGFIRNSREMNFGIVTRNLTPKLSFYAYKNMTSELSGLRFEQSLFGNKGQVRGMLFGKNGKRILVLWSTKDVANVILKLNSKEVKIADIYGNKYLKKCVDGNLKFDVGKSPLYISGFKGIPKRIGKKYQAIVPRDWLVCGPFLCYKDNGFKKDFLSAESGQNNISPKLGDIVKNDSLLGAETKWKNLKADKFGVVNLLPDFVPNTKVFAYAYCNIKSQTNREAVLDVSSDDGNEVWINHKAVLIDHAHRKISEGERLVTVPLHKGNNPCLIKVENRGGGWGFYLRVLGN